jgi:pimeloyl-ACP methyl ester carboxylesterase
MPSRENNTINSTNPALPGQQRRKKPLTVILLVAVAALLFAVLAIRRVHYELLSYSMLVHFVSPQASGLLLRWESNDVTTQEVTIPTPAGPIPARLYLPVGLNHPPGIVITPGVHHLGIDDPRFVNLSRALAASGYTVLSPVLSALTDYHVDASSIPTIGECASWLDQRLNRGPVTVIALSFSGGLALLAADDPQYAPHIRALVVFGGYDDLARVSRFLATDEAELPDGRRIPMKAHDYGASVYVYAHLLQFFARDDLPVAHEALRYWLWEQPENARPLIAQLSPAGRATIEALMARRIDSLRPQLLNAIRADAADLAAISPQGKLQNLRVPVYIVHGAADSVIPYTESLWLEREVPRKILRGVLITPVFGHVDPQKTSEWYEKLGLVHFLAGVLRASS